MSEVQKESYVDDAKRRIAHLSYKLEEAEKKIKTLEYDNAELVQWTNNVCVPRLQEMSDELVNKYNQKRYRGKSYNDLRWKIKKNKKAPGCRHTVGEVVAEQSLWQMEIMFNRQRWYSGAYPKGDGVTLVNQD